MAPSNRDIRKFRESIKGKCYTLSEAVEIMKIMDKYPTGDNDINWVDCKTKTPVSIGYN